MKQELAMHLEKPAQTDNANQQDFTHFVLDGITVTMRNPTLKWSGQIPVEIPSRKETRSHSLDWPNF